MCGTYGDPAAGKHTLEIFKKFREINPTITLGMNTNGSIRSADWWIELASILTLPTDYVVFSLDGLSDTNHIYRVNTNWDNIINNVSTFINAGGNAHWDMLVFDHNNHQVSLAQKTAKELGFKWFRAKVSKRFVTHPVSFLSPPRGWKTPNVTSGYISCQALNESSTYISALGIVYPCCYLSSTTFTINKFDEVIKGWDTTNQNKICSQTCTKNETGTSFQNQWQREVELL